MAEAVNASESCITHEGHRQRMLDTYLKNGIDAFSDVQVLEFLLGYALARVDTNGLAHALLDHFGALHKVFDAPVEQLIQVKGVGLRTAALIRFTGTLWNRTEVSRLSGVKCFRSIPEIGRFLVAKIGIYREERAYLLCLDNSARMIDFRELTRGGVNSVNLPYRKLVETALLHNAAMVVLAHTHVCGSAVPSVEDVSYTRQAQKALKMVDVVLIDHMVISENSYISMKSSGMLNEEAGSSGL